MFRRTYKNEIRERRILKTTKAFLEKAFISGLDEISCGFASFGDFLGGFSVCNRPLCHPLVYHTTLSDVKLGLFISHLFFKISYLLGLDVPDRDLVGKVSR